MDNMHFFEEGMKRVPWDITEVITGKARGIDRLGELWAYRHGIPVMEFPADWKRLGRRAGPLRNAKMAEQCEAAVIFWDGESRGTKDMLNRVWDTDKPVYLIKLIAIGNKASYESKN